MRKIYTITYLLIISNFCFSQMRGVRGFVYDSTENKPLPYAHIVLSSIPLNNFPHYTTTNVKGYFEFRRIEPGKYSLEITFIGYEKYIDTIQIGWGGKNLDTIYLKQSFIKIGDVYVTGKIPQVEQKGDTLEFNAAAFQVSPNASLEDLVLKLPGVEKEENVIKVQGEEVKRVLVDGRRFFGNDPEIAMKNLPADIVEKIQLFDKKSDQAELTGFEDDQTEKTFNVITRVDKRKGFFGKFYGGYGSTDRFNSGINFNSFNANERFSLLGIANNVNQSTFTSDDLGSDEQFTAMPVGRGPRGRGGRNQNPLLNIEIPTSEGNNDIYAFGINYSNVFAEKLEVNGSYFYNHLKNTNNTKSNRKYLSDLSGLDRYNETISSVGKNFNHRFNSFIDYKPDTMNIFRLRPDIQFFTNKNFTTSITENYLINQTLLNSVDFKRNNQTENFDLNNDFVYSYRFPEPGRTFSIGLNTSFSKRLSDYDLFSKNSSFVDSSLITDTLNQISDYVNKRFSQTVNLSFTERAGENSLVRLRFNPQLMIENRSRDTYKSDSLSNNSLIFDSLYSSSFTNQNLAIRGSASYRYNVENFSLEIDLMYQYHLRKGIQKFPRNFETKNRFNAILPSLEIRYQISDFQRLRIEYNTRVQIPSVSQLQNTIDFSNPNFLRTGNPNLDKVLISRFSIRYFVTNPEAGRFNSYSMNVAYTIDNISNSVMVFTRDTTLEGNIFVSRGTQLSYPVNVGNSLNILFNSLNSFRISIIKSNLSFSTSFRYTRTPNLISGKENITYQYGIGENIALSSGNPQLDYRLNYSPDFTYSINSLNRKISRIFIQRFNASIRANIWDEFYFSSKLTFYKNSSLTASKNSSLIWNIGLSYLFLTNRSAELKLEVIDLLNQKKKLERIIREDYFEDRITNQLERFIILSFSYNLRAFK